MTCRGAGECQNVKVRRDWDRFGKCDLCGLNDACVAGEHTVCLIMSLRCWDKRHALDIVVSICKNVGMCDWWVVLNLMKLWWLCRIWTNGMGEWWAVLCLGEVWAECDTKVEGSCGVELLDEWRPAGVSWCGSCCWVLDNEDCECQGFVGSRSLAIMLNCESSTGMTTTANKGYSEESNKSLMENGQRTSVARPRYKQREVPVIRDFSDNLQDEYCCEREAWGHHSYWFWK